MPLDDRRVHAILPEDGELVRYDRAGKWWVEYPAHAFKPRRRVSLSGAVRVALEPGARIRWNVPGGRAFYALAKREGDDER
jgi:hypothetical protein